MFYYLDVSPDFQVFLTYVQQLQRKMLTVEETRMHPVVLVFKVRVGIFFSTVKTPVLSGSYCCYHCLCPPTPSAGSRTEQLTE